jgi:hypothetical protein
MTLQDYVLQAPRGPLISPEFSSQVGRSWTALVYVPFTLRLECVTWHRVEAAKAGKWS